MTPERWAQVKTLFAAAMERAPDERAAFVAAACAGDDALRDELASLLAAAEGTGSLTGVAQAIRSGARAAGLPSALASPEAANATLQATLEAALGSQYEILRPLGHGGMGAVYLARERALERLVAVKVLRPDLAELRALRERFRREARVAAGLSHPGILPLHTFGEVGGLWYFVMGYVRGPSLAERLRVEGALPPAEAHRILAELADALDCAHRGGVVHRDIKPANVLLDADSGRAVLADFGVAKAAGGIDPLTATGAVIGTPGFMSPEQATGSPDVDERSDVYSLGAVGYAMLAAREPFAGVPAAELLYHRLTADPSPLPSSVPPELAAVVMRCLARDRALRWPTARSLGAALARAGGDPAATLPESIRELPTFGPYALLWAAVWAGFAASPFRALGDRVLLVLIAAIVPAGLVLHVWNVGGDGMPPAELARVAFWPPEWWGMWWPRALRRPADLWRRLPWPARTARAALSAFIVALPALILARQWIEATADASLPRTQPGWFGVLEAVLLLGTAGVLGVSSGWARRSGLSWSESARVLFGSTAPSPAWDAGALGRLLAPRGPVRAPDRTSPADHRRAIDELVPLLDAALRDIGADVARAAARLAAALELCDGEVASLGGAGGAGDVDRLRAELAALEDAPSPGAERRELAALVRRQLDVVRRMRERCELVTERRGQLMALLHGLWTQLLAAHTASLPTPPDALRALCTEAERAASLVEPPVVAGPSVRGAGESPVPATR